MATRTVTVDDITGKEATVTRKYTVTFTPHDEKDKLESAEKEMDLTPESAQALWRFLAEGETRDLAAAWPKAVRIRNSNPTEGSPEVVRAWAKEQGMTVNDRGVIAEDVWAAYRAAHPATETK